MGRRASSSLNTPALVGIIVAVLLLIGGGALLMRKKNDGFRGTPLPIEEMFKGANSLRDNVYTLEGVLDGREARDSGDLLRLTVEGKKGEETIPVIVPPETPGTTGTDRVNFTRNARYAFKVRIGEGGIPVATAVKAL